MAYTAFELSGSDANSAMRGSDVAVARIDQQTVQAQVQDYYLNSRQQVSQTGTRGLCGLWVEWIGCQFSYDGK